MSATAPVAILRVGAITSAGINGPASFAALRVRLNNFTPSALVQQSEHILHAHIEQPINIAPTGSFVDLSKSAVERQSVLVAKAISECLDNLKDLNTKFIPLLLCVSDPTLPGRPADLEAKLMDNLQRILGRKFSAQSACYAYGQTATARAFIHAYELLEKHPFVVLAAVDCLTSFETMLGLMERGQLLTSSNSQGYIPGEAACALLLSSASNRHDIEAIFSNTQQLSSQQKHLTQNGTVTNHLYCTSIACDTEPAPKGSRAPQRGQGLKRSIDRALAAMQTAPEQIELRVCSQVSDTYVGNEIALASSRSQISASQLWCLADSFGECGAATGALTLGCLYTAHHKSYAPGQIVVSLLGGETMDRAAMLTHFGTYRP